MATRVLTGPGRLPRQARQTVWLMAWLLSWVLLAPSVWADGKVFSRVQGVVPAMPDQQALIVFDRERQRQTLVIDTRFVARDGAENEGAERTYAWVVPLPGPGVPEIRTTTTGVFPTLQRVCMPRIATGGGTFGIGIGIATLSLLAIAWAMARRGKWAGSVLMCGIVLVLLLIMLPSLGNVQRTGEVEAGVRVLTAQRVGAFDVTVIAPEGGAPSAGRAGEGVRAWLNERGYVVPEEAKEVIETYAREGWVFAACRVRVGQETGNDLRVGPTPLVFTFASAAPVYPMRLTGVGNGPLAVDLYVCSDQAARANGFVVQRCGLVETGGMPRRSSLDELPGAADHPVVIVHPELQQLIGTQRVMTKLSGVLSPEQQRADVRIELAAAKAANAVRYSRSGAAAWSALGAMSVLMVGAAVLVVSSGRKRREADRREVKGVHTRVQWAVLSIVVLALSVGGFVYLLLPVERVVATVSSRAERRAMGELGSAAEPFLKADAVGEAEPGHDALVRAAVRQHLKNENIAMIEEDSPGNYTLEFDSRGWLTRVKLYDRVGQPSAFMQRP